MSNTNIFYLVCVSLMLICIFVLEISISKRPTAVRSEPVDPLEYERNLDEGIQAVLNH